jgi:hypothetical protein
MADSSGNHTFGALANGNYAVTPSKTGFPFNPSRHAVRISSANLAYISFTAVQAASIWSSSAVPAAPADPDPSSVATRIEVQERCSPFDYRCFGSISPPQNRGVHVGNLGTSTGTKLATVTFSNETASGWQHANFTSPVATYMISYYAPSSHYAGDESYFSTV